MSKIGPNGFHRRVRLGIGSAGRPEFCPTDPLGTDIQPESNPCSGGPGRFPFKARSTLIWEIPDKASESTGEMTNAPKSPCW